MNPIPLTSPSGLVYAYACGLCHHVGGGSELLFTPDEPGPIATLVESSLWRATGCCSCRTCGAVKPREWNSKCAPCDWWRDMGSVFMRIGMGYTDKPCGICGSLESDYCRKTPKCINCGDGHGSNDDGRCRDCNLEAVRE